MEYQVVLRGSIPELEKQVRLLIELGWEPQGGIAFSNTNYATTVAQSMIRKEKK